MSRLGTLCGVFGILFACLGTQCFQQDPCDGFDADDGLACTDDSCDNVDGVATAVNTPVDCGDQVCNPADGECVDCLSDADCDTGFCSEAGGNICVECLLDGQCDDANDCTSDTCVNATCTYADAANGAACADDGNECTDDACAAGDCVHTNAADGTACDDGDLCTDADACTAGACGGTDVANCCEVDADCTTAGDVCNTTTNLCETPTPECTLDTDCDDGDACTDDVCVDLACDFPNNTAPCNDDDPCTTSDVCGGGACAGTAVTCPAGQACNPANGNCGAILCTSAVDCADGLACTADTCNQATGECVYTNVNAACNDGQFCSGTWTCDPTNDDADANGCVNTGNPCANPTPVCNEATNACQTCTLALECNDNFPCTSDTCVAGLCNNAPVNANCPNPLKCNGVDFCAPANPDADANGCVQPGNPCDPKLCVEATYVVGDPNTCTNCVSNDGCTDGIICTQDTCNGVTGACSHTNTNSLCPDAAFCNGDDICNPTDADAGADGCVNGLEVAYPCANACNENTNACFACTANSDCNDGVSCTTDTCNGGTGACTHANNCVAPAVCNLQSGQCQ